MPAVALLNNIKPTYITALVMMFLSINLHASETNLIPDTDVEQLRKNFSHEKIAVREEALVKLQWAGIADERVFDPMVEKLQANKKMVAKYAKIYLAALVYSGNPKYLNFLDSLINDNTYSKTIRNTAEKYKPQFEHYQAISTAMNDNNNATSSEEFWAKRYEKGLRVSDNVRMRWAARDLYLSGFNEISYDVAKTFLAENYKTATDDSYVIDAMSFLCKALGMSRHPKYKDILIEVTNNTPNKKLAKYAERSVQYFDQTFTSSNSILKN